MRSSTTSPKPAPVLAAHARPYASGSCFAAARAPAFVLGVRLTHGKVAHTCIDRDFIGIAGGGFTRIGRRDQEFRLGAGTERVTTKGDLTELRHDLPACTQRIARHSGRHRIDVDRGADGEDFRLEGLGLLSITGLNRVPMCDDELLDRILFAALCTHLIRHRNPNTQFIGSEIAELDKRTERLVKSPLLRHSLGVREEVGARIRKKALLRPNLPDHQVTPVMLRNVPKDLLADRNGVVRQVRLAVKLYGSLVMLHCLAEPTDADMEVPDAVVESDVHLLFASEFSERPAVEIERLLPLLILLVLSRLLLEGLDAHTGRSEVSVRPLRRAATCSAKRWDNTRADPGSGSFNLPTESGSTRVSGTIPITSVSTTSPSLRATSAAIRSKTARGEV